MSSNLAVQTSGYPAFAMTEDELINVLSHSLYVGAGRDSIKMVLGYCKASGLDPMQKPVHLVPIWDSKASTMRDVVMAGIGLYRSQASRSGEYAGVTEPEFGEDVNENMSGTQITYPKWCRVTVKRLLPNGMVVDFTAKELWKENYAAKGGKEKSTAPNAMWTKRPYAQLAKCAEAQALRKAFPELGAQPTAEEMEGKEFDVTPEPQQSTTFKKPEPTIYTDQEFFANENAWKKVISNGKTPNDFFSFIESKGKLFTEDQKLEIASWVTAPVVVEGEATQVQDDFVAQMNNAESEK